jgi:hypothetical protein
MPHWVLTLAAVLGGCLLLVAGGFALGRCLNALSRSKTRGRLRL